MHEREGEALIEFLAMGGYGYYVWSAYGMAALAVVVELLALRARRRGAMTSNYDSVAR